MSRLSRFIHFYTDEDEGNGGGGDPGILKTVTGALLHITDALAKPAKKFTATLEPIQDLHGQANPYPAGGGKNKAPNLTEWESGYLNSSGNVDPADATKKEITSPYIPITAGSTYTFSMHFPTAPSDLYWAAICYYTVEKAFINRETQDGSSVVYHDITATAANNAAYARLSFRSYGIVDKVQFELGSTATAWSPYENICPITGHTGVSVVRTGKNVLDPNWIEYGKNHDGTASTSRLCMYKKMPVGTYTVSISSMGVFSELATGRRVEKYNRSTGNGYPFSSSTLVQTVVITEALPYLYLFGIKSDGTTPTISDIEDSIHLQAEYSGTASDYEAPSITTIPVTFPDAAGTVYGGTLTNEGGECKLRVDRETQNLGDLTWTAHPTYGFYSGGLKTIIKAPSGNAIPVNALCSNYKIVSQTNETTTNYSIACDTTGIIYINDNNYSDAATFKAALNGVQLVYELATPIEYTLTESQALTLLKGTNNVFCDSSDDLELQYYAKAEETP